MEPLEPTIVQHDKDDEEFGIGYAYYNRGKKEIHILSPTVLYEKVLAHEHYHGKLSQLVSIVQDSFSLRVSLLFMVLAVFTLIAVDFFRIAFGLIPPALLVSVMSGMVLTIPVLLVLGQVLGSLEEVFADRYATLKLKAREWQARDTPAS